MLPVILPKIIIILLLLAPAALFFYSLAEVTGKRERLAPPSKPQPGEKVLNPPSTWIVSSSPLWGSSELLQAKTAISPPDAKLLNADHEPALSVCLSVSYRLSICNKCHRIITFLRICTDRQQPSSLAMFTCIRLSHACSAEAKAAAGKRSSGAGVVYLFKQVTDVALLITVSPQ